jgi:hypothetical protein
VAGCCEYGDESSGSGATEFVICETCSGSQWKLEIQAKLLVGRFYGKIPFSYPNRNLENYMKINIKN